MFESEQNPEVALDCARRFMGMTDDDEFLLQEHASLLLSGQNDLEAKLGALRKSEDGHVRQFPEAAEYIIACLGAQGWNHFLTRLVLAQNDVAWAERCIQAGKLYRDVGISMIHVTSLYERCLDHIAGLLENAGLGAEKTGRLLRAVGKKSMVDKLLQFKGYWMAANRNTADQLLQYTHLYRLYATLSKVSMAILHADDLSTLYQSFCNAAVKYGFCSAWVARPVADGNLEFLAVAGSFMPELSPDLPINTRQESPHGNGPTGKAIRTGAMQIVDDACIDPCVEPWRHRLGKYSIRSIVTMPLTLNGQTVACFTLYADEPDFFGEKERELVAIIGREISQVLSWLNTRQDNSAMQAKLSWHQQHDALTGLPVREFMLQHIRHLLQKAENGRSVTVVLLAIDQFSELNGRYGYVTGDAVLCMLSKLLQEKVGRYGVVGRLGGNCFAVATDQPGWALPMLESIHKRIAAPHLVQRQTLRISASIGVAEASGSCLAEDLLCRANRALDRACLNGGNQWCHFEDKLDDVEYQKTQLCNDVRNALRNNEFMAYFQPKVNLLTNEVAGAEALVRWRRDGNILAPAAFLPFIVDTELMPALDWYMLNAVAEILSSPSRFSGEVACVSVNLSSRTLAAADFVPRLMALLKRHELSPCLFELEVLETVAQHEARAIENLEQCRRQGFRIALDDFGTGASSLVHLQLIPADTIKIDRRFIRQIHEQKESMAIVGSMVSFARLAGKKLCVEGVETEEMKQLLIELGCIEGQGFLMATPMCVSDFESWLGRREKTDVLKFAQGD